MRAFNVGEEVILDGAVYVVSARMDGPPMRYRLLASRPEGTRFEWVDGSELQSVDTYIRAHDDTENY